MNEFIPVSPSLFLPKSPLKTSCENISLKQPVLKLTKINSAKTKALAQKKLAKNQKKSLLDDMKVCHVKLEKLDYENYLKNRQALDKIIKSDEEISNENNTSAQKKKSKILNQPIKHTRDLRKRSSTGSNSSMSDKPEMNKSFKKSPQSQSSIFINRLSINQVINFTNLFIS